MIKRVKTSLGRKGLKVSSTDIRHLRYPPTEDSPSCVVGGSGPSWLQCDVDIACTSTVRGALFALELQGLSRGY